MAKRSRPPGKRDDPLVHHVCHRFTEAARIKDAWDSLASQEGDLFCSYDWCEVWWRHYGRGRRLEIHTIHQDTQLVGIVPLFRETLWLGGAGLRVVRLVGCDHVVTPPGLAIRPDVADGVMATVLKGLKAEGRWDVLQMGPLHSYITSMPAIVEACHRHSAIGTVVLGRHEDCVSVFQLPDTYDEYLASLQGSERRNILRCQRHLEAAHRVRMSIARTPAEAREAMTALVGLHQALWMGKGKQGQFRRMPGLEAFHKDIVARMGCAGQLILVTLRVDGQICGVEYACRFGPRVYTLIRGYRDDVPWAPYSIGRMLHCHTIREAIRQGVRLVDDGRGPFEYKRRLGARLECEQSITILPQGRLMRVRFWLALWVARAWHASYCRGLVNRVRGWIGLSKQPLSHRHIRLMWLAQMLWRTHFRATGKRLETALCMCNTDLCPYRAPSSQPGSRAGMQQPEPAMAGGNSRNNT